MLTLQSTQSYSLCSARRDGAWAWAIAAGAFLGAVALRMALDPYLGDTAAFVAMVGAVAIAVWVVGARVAAGFALVGYLICYYLFLGHFDKLFSGDVRTVAGLIAYAVTCGLIIAIGDAMRTAQERAHARGELLRVALAGIGDAIIATDIESRIIYLNESAEVLTGWSCTEAVGHPLNSVFRLINSAGDDGAVAQATLSPCAEGRAQSTQRAVLLGRDAVARPIEHSTAPIKDSDGLIAGCVVTFCDITEKQRLEREDGERASAVRLLASIVEASDDAILSSSLDGIVRTWNAAAERLLGYSQAEMIGNDIERIIPSDRREQERELFDAALKAGHRVEHFETERVHKSGRQVHVSLTISPVLDEAGHVVGAVKIASDMTRQSAVAQRERLLLREVAATNERSRALEEEVSKLAADVCEADRRRNVFLATLARELRDLVKPLSFALENAKRADSDRCTTATAIEAIERQTTRIVRLVDHLRGLSCVSSDEQALREDASRPVAPEDEGPSVVPSAASAAAPKLSRRVLVVDDDHHCANSLVRLLKLDGHLTFVAHDGAEALDAVERHRPDVVFLDLGMPVLDGYEACRRLRERPYGKDLIIVALTAWGRASDRRKSKEAGFDGHFVKPANYDALAAVLDPGAARKTECA